MAKCLLVLPTVTRCYSLYTNTQDFKPTVIVSLTPNKLLIAAKVFNQFLNPTLHADRKRKKQGKEEAK